jgi:glycosyltransferase involved in cell wall biosynthesis
VVRAFELWGREREAGGTLDLVGEPLSPGYGERFAPYARGAVSQERLNEHYRRAGVLLSMSEHEGFCVPLLEAFHFGLPVVARPAGGMPEVGGDAVLWTDGEDLAEVAELIQLAVRDEELRVELAERGRARLEEFAPQRVGELLRAAVG